MLRRLYDWTMKLAGHRRANWALAAVSFIESSVFPIPPDVMLIPMVLAQRHKAMLIAGICTVASVLGGLLGYAIGLYLFDTIGQPILDFYGYGEKFGSFQERYIEWGVWIVLIAGLTPFPYKVITIASGVYSGMIAAMRAFIPAAGKLLLVTPVYSGFYTMARNAHVATVDSQMIRKNGRYEVNWEDLEAKMTSDIRAMVVCNPQNPTGNVWTEEELLRMGRLALEHNIVVLSDEIHSDVIRSGHKYVPFASLPDRAVVNNSVSFNAISKTFNMAGMKNAYFYSKSPTMLDRVDQYHHAELSTLGVVANAAAYRHGAEWFDQANAYLDENHTFMENYIKQNMPDVVYTKNEGTFMTFLDVSKIMTSIGAAEQYIAAEKASPEYYFRDWLVHNSGVYLNPGSVYGAGGEGHVRMNLASSRMVLKEVLDSMTMAFNKV